MKNKKNIKSFIQDLEENKKGAFPSGSIRGGFQTIQLSTNSTCANKGTCTGTSEKSCVNSDDCSGATNSNKCSK